MQRLLGRALLLTLLLGCAGLAAWSQAPSGGASRPAPAQSVPNFGNAPDADFSHGSNYHTFDREPLKFTSEVKHVLVPVIVRDRQGKHVGGLKKEDFRVFENGKERKVVSLEEIQASAKTIARNVPESGIYSNLDLAQEPPRRVTAIVIDLVNTPFLDQKTARQAVIELLADGVDERSIYALFAIQTNGLFMLHDYTTDTKTLITALSRVKAKLSTTQTVDQATMIANASDKGATTDRIANPEGMVAYEYELLSTVANAETLYAGYKEGVAAGDTLAAFQQIASRLAGVPGRKSMIWLTGSFPFTIDSTTEAISMDTPFLAYQRTMQLLNDANIAVYPVDTRGLLVNLMDASEHISGRAMLQPQTTINAKARVSQNSIATMQQFAAMTGGRAYYNRNDIANALRNAVDDSEAYYMLTYPMDNENTKQGWRKINVKLASLDHSVRAREGYFATKGTLEAGAFAGIDLQNAMNSPFDFTSLPLSVKLEPPAGAGPRRNIEFAMTLPARSISLSSESQNHLHLDVAYVVKDEAGKEVDRQGESFNADLNPQMVEQVQTKGLMWGKTLHLSPGRYSARFVLRDNNSGKIGSVVAPLQVD